MEQYEFRFAKIEDVELILDFITELAIYEDMLDDVVATKELLTEWLFDKPKAEVLFLLVNNQEVGMALFFHNFSTFLGKSGLYLEDLLVKPQYRGNGYGTKILEKLASIAVERQCGRFEWSCLDWNKPSIDFYLSKGAVALDEWTVYRVSGKNLISLAKNNKL